MFDQLQKMMDNPQARDMLFSMIAQQVAQAPPERREAMARVTVTLEKTPRGMHVSVGRSDDPQVETTIRDTVENWADFLARGFQSIGFKVEIVE